MEASEQIDQMIAGLTDWRGETLANVRRTILSADPGIIETWKWRGAPVWEHTGIIAVANAFKEKVKLVFYHGACLPDPEGLFNAELTGNQWRTVEFHQGDQVNAPALMALIRAAVQDNLSRKAAK
jgi:hypothetical protein